MKLTPKGTTGRRIESRPCPRRSWLASRLRLHLCKSRAALIARTSIQTSVRRAVTRPARRRVARSIFWQAATEGSAAQPRRARVIGPASSSWILCQTHPLCVPPTPMAPFRHGRHSTHRDRPRLSRMRLRERPTSGCARSHALRARPAMCESTWDLPGLLSPVRGQSRMRGALRASAGGDVARASVNFDTRCRGRYD
jgi:hypothetical protein